MRHSRRLAVLCLVACAFASAHAALPIPKPPAIDARALILIDHDSGRVLAESNADERMEPASLTKVMTGYIAFEALKDGRLTLTEEIPISERAWKSEGSRSFVQVGTRIPVEVLLKGMIVQSGNDATIALAERLGGSEEGFAQIMNAYAKKLGMRNTNYENSTGLPGANHYTTARDMATLARAVIRDYPEYYQWYSLREFVWNNIRQQNRNGLLARDASVDGIKTGHTESAGYCLATSAKRDGMRLVSAVFGTKSMRAREDASAALLNYGFTFYETVKLKGRGETVLAPRLYKGEEENIAIGPRADVYVTVGRGDAAQVTTAATANEPLLAPADPATAAGELVVSVGNDVVSRVPLYPLKAVPEGGWWTRMIDGLLLMWH
ncbi:MAG TPA: D-alanyl-D-alanine carboxypeptidase family protein [Steroidobacteraceae bacterium]|nr:D-alanyl-D-alanine carboxypeptidase family protein [Steroidobacteraceae bacterium]HNS28004.1 D-alanyl-D-alanine carboxypeptidase family protein [Steroidobacteraceae bacterium]